MRRKHVRWTDEEREKIAEEFVILRLTDPLGLTHQLLDQAVKKSVKPERFRKINVSINTALTSLIESKFALMVEDLRGDPIVVEREVKVAAKTDQEILKDLPLVDLCTFALGRFINERGPLAPTATLLTPETTAKPSTFRWDISEPRREPKLRIVIIGIMRQQSHAIADKCPKDVDIKFIDRESTPRRIESSADYVIVHKASHSWMDVIKKDLNGAAGQKVIYCKDGVNGVVQKVMELRSKWISAHNAVKL